MINSPMSRLSLRNFEYARSRVIHFCMRVHFFFFFFQAEDGIRDRDVTGVQTCALPISRLARRARRLLARVGVPLPAPRSPDIVNGLGRGYGSPTVEGEAARQLAAQHGLVLDSTYGAKAFGVLLRRGTWNVQRVVFWHTFAMPAALPESMP